jgi:hypothetical protein
VGGVPLYVIIRCTAWRTARPGSVHRREHIAVQHDERHPGLHRAVVEAGVDDGDEIERRDDKDALAAETDRSAPVDFAIADKRAAEPELIAVEIELLAVDMRRRRLFYERRGDDLLALPGARASTNCPSLAKSRGNKRSPEAAIGSPVAG